MGGLAGLGRRPCESYREAMARHEVRARWRCIRGDTHGPGGARYHATTVDLPLLERISASAASWYGSRGEARHRVPVRGGGTSASRYFPGYVRRQRE